MPTVKGLSVPHSAEEKKVIYLAIVVPVHLTDGTYFQTHVDACQSRSNTHGIYWQVADFNNCK